MCYLQASKTTKTNLETMQKRTKQTSVCSIPLELQSNWLEFHLNLLEFPLNLLEYSLVELELHGIPLKLLHYCQI